MPVSGIGQSAPFDFSVGASAQAAAEQANNRAATKLSDEQKEQMFLQKMNEGQKMDDRPRTAENQDKLGKDDFMKLLIATLKYQDPSSPMDTQKLLEQTSLMTNMEQMMKMTEASQKAFEAQQRVQGTSMVGKTVVYDSQDSEGNAITTAGKVEAIEFLAKGEVLLHVGAEKIKMDKVLGVAEAGEATAPVKPAPAVKKTEEAKETQAPDEAAEAEPIEEAESAEPAEASTETTEPTQEDPA